MRRIRFMNIEIDNLSLDESINEINQVIINNRKVYVVTPNVDHLVKLRNNKLFLEAYRSAGLVIVDGTPIFVASKWFGTPIKEKITGPVLTEETIKMASNNNYSVYFLGGGPGVAESAAINMLKKYPNLKIAGTYSPSFGFENDENEKNEIIKKVNDSEARILITGMGSPKTEIFLNEIYNKLSVNVSLSIGATIDFMAGTVKRCPLWVNKIGMEWFYRFLQNPKKMWGRYFVEDVAFISMVLKEKKRIRRNK